jgi:hypothetical protein
LAGFHTCGLGFLLFPDLFKIEFVSWLLAYFVVLGGFPEVKEDEYFQLEITKNCFLKNKCFTES